MQPKPHASRPSTPTPRVQRPTWRTPPPDRLARSKRPPGRPTPTDWPCKTELGVAAAEEAKREYDNRPVEPAWDDPESTRVDQRTWQLLDEAAAPDASPAAAADKGRRAAVKLIHTGVPWSREMAYAALAGTDEEVRVYVSALRLLAADEDDRTRVRHLADSTPKPEFKTAAEGVLRSDSGAVRQFLVTQHYEGKYQDDRVKIAQFIETGGSATRAAGARALEGTEADQHAFIRTGQHVTRQQDKRVAVAELLHAGGPEVKSAATIALAGPPSYVTEFLEVGRYKAARLDHDTATHVARVRGLVADAANIAATAQANAAEAQCVAAIARNAAAEAEGHAQRRAIPPTRPPVTPNRHASPRKTRSNRPTRPQPQPERRATRRRPQNTPLRQREIRQPRRRHPRRRRTPTLHGRTRPQPTRRPGCATR